MTSLEWALVAGAFMLMLISIFDLVRYVVVLQSVTTVTTEAGRACVINFNNCPQTGWSQLSTIAPMLDPSQCVISTVAGQKAANLSGNANAGWEPGTNVAQVTVSYPFVAMTPWMSSLNATITETATYFH